MQRWGTMVLGLVVGVLAVWLVLRDFKPPTPIGHDPNPRPTTEADAGAAIFALGDAALGGLADDGGPLLLEDLVDGRRMDGGAGGTMMDGTPVPALPLTAPRQVRFGVVLVSYAGAQPSATGTGRVPQRSKAEARALADRLAVAAAQDFHAAVQQGDGGSSDDVGRVKLGVLEPAPEYVLFNLGVEGVGGPVDTPRGYWIVKRLE